MVERNHDSDVGISHVHGTKAKQRYLVRLFVKMAVAAQQHFDGFRFPNTVRPWRM